MNRRCWLSRIERVRGHAPTSLLRARGAVVSGGGVTARPWWRLSMTARGLRLPYRCAASVPHHEFCACTSTICRMGALARHPRALRRGQTTTPMPTPAMKSHETPFLREPEVWQARRADTHVSSSCSASTRRQSRGRPAEPAPYTALLDEYICQAQVSVKK